MPKFRMIKESDLENLDDPQPDKGGSHLIIQDNPLHSEARQNALKKTKRRRLVLGRMVHTLPNGSWKLGGVVHHIPSPFGSQTEAIYFKGPPGSGKSWAAYSLAGQSFFAENRTWVLIDTKLSVTKNTKVYVKINGREQNVKIGKLIDEIIPETNINSKIRKVENDIQTLTIRNHKLSWQPVRFVSKHKSPQRIIKITARSGREVEATEGHSFVTLKNGEYGSKKGSDLKIGDFVPVSKDFSKLETHDKYLIDINHIIRELHWEKKDDLKNILGKDFITISNAQRLYEALRPYPKRAEKLKKMIDGDIWWDRIDKIEHLDPTSEFVYDLQVNESENFMLSNGISVMNSYLGNNRPNYKFMDQIQSVSGFPRGIPHTQIDIIAPMYYVAGLSPQEIKDSWVTNYYKVPLRFCTLPVMFELTKLNKKAGYASSFDQSFKDLMIRTNNNPRISDVNEMIQSIIDDPEMSRMKWVYQMMRKKIEEVSDLTIDDRSQWSPIGECLLRAAEEGRARWVVFTLGHAQNPEDDLNLAIISTVLKEIHVFSEMIRHNPSRYPNFQVGVMMDELHTYVRNKDASTRSAIHDLLFAWGRTSKVLRMFLSLPPEERIWCIDPNDQLRRIPIGELVDNVISKYPEKVHEYQNKFYEAIEENVDGWRVFTRDPKTMKLEIKPIDAFIRHDNVDEIFQIETENGRKVKVTGCHSVYTKNVKDGKPKKVEVRTLRKGDWIEVTDTNFSKDTKSFYEKLKSLKRETRDTNVYDISVNGHENFISESGIVCSNTQKDEQLDKVFRDDIKKEVKPEGTYQCVISCSAIPEPGYVTYVNRVQPDSADPESPLYYPKVKSCPPLFDVESDEPDDEKWKDKVIDDWRNGFQPDEQSPYLM